MNKAFFYIKLFFLFLLPLSSFGSVGEGGGKKKNLVVIYVHGTVGFSDLFRPERLLRNFLGTISIFFNDLKNDNLSSSFFTKLREKRWKNLQPGVVSKKNGLYKLCSLNHDTNKIVIDDLISDEGKDVIRLFFENWKRNKGLSDDYDVVDFYCFGWSGLLSITERRDVSQRLKVEIIRLQQKHKNGEFCVIGYSHGGTVSLGVGRDSAVQKSVLQPIEHLIILGTPIFKDNEELMVSKVGKELLFKNIVLIVSKGDMVQGSDITMGGVHITKKNISRYILLHNSHICQGTVCYESFFGKKIFYPDHGSFEEKKGKKPAVLSYIPFVLEKLIGKGTLHNNFCLTIPINEDPIPLIKQIHEDQFSGSIRYKRNRIRIEPILYKCIKILPPILTKSRIAMALCSCCFLYQIHPMLQVTK